MEPFKSIKSMTLSRTSIPNELLIMIFKCLLYQTSFEFMDSIRLCCKTWNDLINLILIEEVGYKINKQMNIECASASYDSSQGTFVILIRDDKFEQLIGLFPSAGDVRCENLNVRLHYDNGAHVFVFNFGFVRYWKEKLSEGRSITRNENHWRYKNCTCDYLDMNNPDSLVIKMTKLTIPLKIMYRTFDSLDG
ncbi:11264_t:CDS:2 [Funneliformis caledonium]|uniref:11264_t:CDS:1 n=1 Tax=Funneliformis caledonium TaxID=1117310 RepID=A0A9N8WEL0_9GLOM|nr:11264_t:CDS:2 [Funneliformis caledonium]